MLEVCETEVWLAKPCARCRVITVFQWSGGFRVEEKVHILERGSGRPETNPEPSGTDR